MATVDAALVRSLAALSRTAPAALAAQRYRRFRALGAAAVRKERA